jgi:tripartite-type tricarboxylate transporter receptor subunit TctC
MRSQKEKSTMRSSNPSKVGPIAILVAALVCASAWAQGWPIRAVRIVVPFGAGGGTDTIARVVAERLQEAMGQPFVVENRPGATSNVGASLVARAPADGYTLLLITSSVSINQAMPGKKPFDTIRDFAPVVRIGSSPVLIAGNAGFPVASIPQLVAFAKAHPGKISYAMCAVGAPQHMAGELLKMMAGIDIVHVAYKGCAQAVPDVLSGQVPVTISTVANLAPHIKAGKITAYAVTAARRSSFAPEVPTVAESGYPDFDIDVWFGMLAPSGTPKEIVARLNAETNRILERAEVRSMMASQNFEVIGGSSEAFGAVIRQEVSRYARIIQAAGIRPE